MARSSIIHGEPKPAPLPDCEATLVLNRGELVALRFILNDATILNDETIDRVYKRALSTSHKAGELNPHFRSKRHFEELVNEISSSLGTLRLNRGAAS